MVNTGIDYDSFFQNKIDSMLVTASWVDRVQDLLGIEAVSQLWGYKPAWYVWISDAQGVYLLQLDAAHGDSLKQETARGMFSVICYPFPDATVLNTFSYEERYLIQSPLFDHTHTPRFEAKDKIPDHLFRIAAMEYEINHDDGSVCFTLESLSHWRSIYNAETFHEYDVIGRSHRFAEGDIDRSVPGWKLGYPFFDRILSLYAFYSKTKPNRIRITRSPGFEFVYDGSKHPECVDASDVYCYSASVFFGPPGKSGPCADAEYHRSNKPEVDPSDGEVIFDHVLHCGHYHPLEGTDISRMPEGMGINKLWWTLAEAEYKSELASTCGCS